MTRIKRFDLKQDSIELYELSRKPDIPALFPQQPKFLNFEQFQHWLDSQLGSYFHDLYVLEEGTSKKWKIIGILLAYDYRIYDSHCLIFGYSQQGITESILSQFIEILFTEYPLNKVFLKVYGSDQRLLSAAERSGFTTEAIFHQNCFLEGTYQDLHILGFYRRTGNNKNEDI